MTMWRPHSLLKLFDNRTTPNLAGRVFVAPRLAAGSQQFPRFPRSGQSTPLPVFSGRFRFWPNATAPRNLPELPVLANRTSPADSCQVPAPAANISADDA